MLFVCLVTTAASVWLCVINYKTTYAELSSRLPQEASIALTVFVQGFEFLIPILTLLGIMNALELSRELKIGVNITWYVVMVLDFATAFVYLAGKKTDPLWSDIAIAGTVSLLFLFAELFVVLSATGMVVSFLYWRSGAIPELKKSASNESKSSFSSYEDTANPQPSRLLRKTRGGHQLWLFTDGKQQWVKDTDPRIAEKLS